MSVTNLVADTSIIAQDNLSAHASSCGVERRHAEHPRRCHAKAACARDVRFAYPFAHFTSSQARKLARALGLFCTPWHSAFVASHNTPPPIVAVLHRRIPRDS